MERPNRQGDLHSDRQLARLGRIPGVLPLGAVGVTKAKLGDFWGDGLGILLIGHKPQVRHARIRRPSGLQAEQSTAGLGAEFRILQLLLLGCKRVGNGPQPKQLAGSHAGLGGEE